ECCPGETRSGKAKSRGQGKMGIKDKITRFLKTKKIFLIGEIKVLGKKILFFFFSIFIYVPHILKNRLPQY
ncbi:hypothetical protein ACEF20_12315, partial [Staphylococcus epidermidis]